MELLPTALPTAQNDKEETQLTDGFVMSGRGVGKSLDGGHLNSLIVVGENVPWEEAQNNTASDISQRGDVRDPGIWASSALFDSDGVIIGWTEWERVFVSANDDYDNEGQTAFLAVDCLSGKCGK